MKRLNRCLPLLAVLPALACTVLMRDPDYYHYDVMKALEPREEALKVCYDQVLESDDRAAGTVFAVFTVEKKTGSIKQVEVLGDKTTAPPALVQCATAQLAGLTIEAPDAQDAVAEYQWDFILNIDEDALVEEEVVAPPQDVPPEGPPSGGTTDAAQPGAQDPPAEADDEDEVEPDTEAEVTFEIGE